MPVEFRYATLNEYPRISAFLDQHWARGHVYTRMRSLFDWTFHRSGHWDEHCYSFLLAEEGEELVGILGAIPFTLNRFGRSSKAIWIVNYVVRADYRRGVTALKLLSSFRRLEFSAVVAFGINPATASIYQVLRGQVLPEIPRHFVVFPGNRERMERLLHITYPDWPEERATALATAFELCKMPATHGKFDHSIPRYWEERDWPEFASRTIGAVRDTDYLIWRYREHPVFAYRFVTVPDGSRTGLAVWRLETIHRQTAGGLADVDRVGRLVEFLPASPANAEDLHAAFLSEAEAAGAMCADYYGYHGEFRSWLHELGLRCTESHPDGPALPSRFQPLDSNGGGITSAMFLQDGAPPAATDRECCWYWTKSDSDQDRPN